MSGSSFWEQIFSCPSRWWRCLPPPPHGRHVPPEHMCLVKWSTETATCDGYTSCKDITNGNSAPFTLWLLFVWDKALLRLSEEGRCYVLLRLWAKRTHLHILLYTRCLIIILQDLALRKTLRSSYNSHFIGSILTSREKSAQEYVVSTGRAGMRTKPVCLPSQFPLSHSWLVPLYPGLKVDISRG